MIAVADRLLAVGAWALVGELSAVALGRWTLVAQAPADQQVTFRLIVVSSAERAAEIVFRRRRPVPASRRSRAAESSDPSSERGGLIGPVALSELRPELRDALSDPPAGRRVRRDAHADRLCARSASARRAGRVDARWRDSRRRGALAACAARSAWTGFPKRTPRSTASTSPKTGTRTRGRSATCGSSRSATSRRRCRGVSGPSSRGPEPSSPRTT